MKKLQHLLLASILTCAIPIVQGCARQSETTVKRTTTTTTRSVPIDSETADSATQQTTTTTNTTTKTPEEPSSVLGATAHAVATIILLPFRLVGDALGLIF